MGYYSNVRLVVSKKGYKALSQYVRNYLGPHQLDNNLLRNADFKKKTSYGYAFGWNDIKWYQGDEEYYKDVNAMMSGIKYLTNKNLSFNFVKVGQDYDDYEEIYNDGENIDLPFPTLDRSFDYRSLDI